MNSQTPTPDDGQPTEPLPERDNTHPTEPLPAASSSSQGQEPVQESANESTGEPGRASTSGSTQDTSSGPYTGPSAGPYSAPTSGSYAYAGMPDQQGDFFGWVRGHGISRGQDRWIGGVSSGIAHRLGIDPLIIRGVFIVLTLFAGIGVLLYGLAWAFLPEPDGRIHVQEAGAGRWTSGMTGSLIATILGFSGLGGGFWGWGNHGFGAFLWTIFWVGGAIYLIYYLVRRNKAAAGVPAGAAAAGTNAYAAGFPTATTPPYSDVAGTGPFTGSPYGGSSSGTSTGTPSGSGYNGSGYGSGAYGGSGSGGSGSGGSGWDNTRPPQGPPPAPKVRPAGPGAPAVAIVAGSALLVGAGLKALDVTRIINLGDSANAIAWASAAAVLGLGILMMGLRGRTSGILSFFAVAALIVGGIFNVVGNNGDRMRFQQLNWSPSSIEDARNGLDVAGSRGTVDLTQLDGKAPLASDVVVPLDIAASNVTIVIPDKMPVDIKADMAMGNIHESGGNRGGVTTRESSYNSDQPGSHLIIEIDGAFSNITIEEGN